MNFFERQRQVRRMSLRLVVLFVARRDRHRHRGRPGRGVRVQRVQRADRPISCVLLVATSRRCGGRRSPWRRWSAPPPCAAAAAGSPASSAASSCRPDTTDPQLRRLRNVVEEMAIASGVPVPEIYVLQQRDRHQRVRGRLVHVGRRDRGHPRRAGAAQPRRAAGRDRARVQPRPQRRHAAQHPADRAAVRHPVPVHHRPDPAAGSFYRRRSRPGRETDSSNNPLPIIGIALLVAGGDRGARRSDHQGVGVAAARVPGRRLGGAVHPPDQRASPAR